MRTPRPADDRGETLIELLVTIVIMGIGVTAVLGAIATSVALSATHRKQAVAGAYLRAYAEAVESDVAASPSAYKSCAGTSDYEPLFSVPAPYTATVTSVAYWNGTTFASACGTDSGVQRVSLRVATSDNKVVETLSVIIRRPCRPASSFPDDTPCT